MTQSQALGHVILSNPLWSASYAWISNQTDELPAWIQSSEWGLPSQTCLSGLTEQSELETICYHEDRGLLADCQMSLPYVWHISVWLPHSLPAPHLIYRQRPNHQTERSAAILSQSPDWCRSSQVFLKALRMSLHLLFLVAHLTHAEMLRLRWSCLFIYASPVSTTTPDSCWDAR